MEYDTLKLQLLAEHEYEDLSQLFKMFADPTRLRIFTVLSQGEIRVDDLRQVLDMSQSAISHQLSSLRKMNLVKTRRVAQSMYYSLSDDHVMQIFKQALVHIRE